MLRTLTIHVKPGKRANNIQEQPDGSLKVELTARAEKGKANEALLRLLSNYLQVPCNSITIKTGAASRTKLVQFLPSN